MRLSLLFIALFLSSYTAICQDNNKIILESLNDSKLEFALPDSLKYLTPWNPKFDSDFNLSITPISPMSSVVLIKENNLPTRINIINKNTFQLLQRLNISNGQAWNYGRFPNSYLDARTLSFPLPR